jgi:hypothetical protein
MKKLLANAFIFASLLNFVVFWTAAVCIGGSAVGGKVDNGKYYLVNHRHYTEVSQAVFEYSQAHSYVTIATFVLMLIVVNHRNSRDKPKLLKRPDTL